MAGYYVSALAGGGGLGTEISPWTLAEAIAAQNAGAVNDGDRVFVKADGVYSIAQILLTNAGIATAFIEWIGYGSLITDKVRAVVRSLAAGGLNLFEIPLYIAIRNFELDGTDGGGSGVNNNGGTWSIENCEIHHFSQYGAHRYGSIVSCYIHDCTYGCRDVAVLSNSIIDDISVDACYSTANAIINSVIRNSGRYGAFAIRGFASNSIFDGGSDIQAGTSLYTVIINCLFNNSPAGTPAIYFADTGQDAMSSFVSNVNFWNCPTRSSDDGKLISYTELNPQFVDTSSDDYRIKNQLLRATGFSELCSLGIDYAITPGVDQVAITLPSVGDVSTDESSWGWDADPSAGTYVEASDAYYRNGEQYGAGGTEHTGRDVLPTAGQIQLGIGAGTDGTEITGTLEAIAFESGVDLTISEDSLELEIVDG